MRTAANINWTIGGAINSQVNTSAGKITVKKNEDGTESFTFGTKIYVVGVDAVTGKTLNETVETGMAQNIDEIEMVGFVNSKGDKTKIEQSLPSDFAKKTWYLLYKTKDQGGHDLDSEKYDSQKITFIVEQPLLVDSTFEAGDLYTVNGIEYASVLVTPGQYAEQGGEVTFNAISNKTGKKNIKNFVIGEGKILSSIELGAPVDIIADGDEKEIPYKALATDGTEIKNYETIVRSTNKVSLNASEGELKIVQNDDGTAKIIWSDDVKYKPNATDNCYSQPGIANSIARNVLLTTIVAGGQNAAPLMLNVKDMRRPDSIQTADETRSSNTVVSGNGIGNNYGYDKDWGAKYYDQYGDILPADRVVKFFEQADTTDGVAGKHYGVLIERGSDAKNIINYYNGVDQSKVVLTHKGVYSIASNGDETEIEEGGSLSGYWPGTVSAKEKTQFTTKYSIVSKAVNTEKKSNWTTASKVISNTYAVVPLSYMKSFEITDTSARYQLITENTNNANGMGMTEKIVATTAAISENNETLGGVIKFKVKGVTKDNTTVEIPSMYYRSVNDSLAGIFNVTQSDIVTQADEIKAVSGGAISWNELYDENSARLTRIEASKTLRLLICSDTNFANADADIRQVVTKTIQISDAGSAIQTFTFGANNKPTNTKLENIVKDIVIKDQYGMDIPGSVTSSITYTITDITENDFNNKDLGKYAHMANSFTVRGQSTSNVSLEGVEIGDKFKITGTIPGANKSYSVDVTVGSDTYAVLSSLSANSKDAQLRKTLGVRE